MSDAPAPRPIGGTADSLERAIKEGNLPAPRTPAPGDGAPPPAPAPVNSEVRDLVQSGVDRLHSLGDSFWGGASTRSPEPSAPQAQTFDASQFTQEQLDNPVAQATMRALNATPDPATVGTDTGGDSFWGGVGNALGNYAENVGNMIGGPLQAGGDALDWAGDAQNRIDSWLNPHDNKSEAEFTQDVTDFYNEHGPESEWDADAQLDWEMLAQTAPAGLKPENQLNALADKVHGAGVAVEATGKGVSTFAREPGETTEFVWNNRGEIARQGVEYLQSKLTLEEAAKWGAAAGGALTFAGMRARQGGGNTAPASRGLLPSPMARTRQNVANRVAPSADATGLGATLRTVGARRIEPQRLPATQRPGSVAAQRPAGFNEGLWEAKRWGGRAAAVDTLNDIVNAANEAGDVVNRYNPRQTADGLEGWNDLAAGRSVREVGQDALRDPFGEGRAALDAAEAAGLPAPGDWVHDAFPQLSTENKLIGGALAAGAVAYGASKLLGGGGGDEKRGADDWQPTAPGPRQPVSFAPLSQPGTTPARSGGGGVVRQSRAQRRGATSVGSSFRDIRDAPRTASGMMYPDVRDPYEEEEEEDQVKYQVRDPYARR